MSGPKESEKVLRFYGKCFKKFHENLLGDSSFFNENFMGANQGSEGALELYVVQTVHLPSYIALT
jgi:hypothetical protein